VCNKRRKENGAERYAGEKEFRKQKNSRQRNERTERQRREQWYIAERMKREKI